ncbi:MAG: glycerate kinase type-2 family protein [Anaerolineae bacterium]
MPIRNWDALTSHGNVAGRQFVAAILQAGLEAADPYENIRQLVRVEGDRLLVGQLEFDPLGSPVHGTDVYDLNRIGRILVLGGGKGIQRAALALEDALGDRLTGGHVIDKKGGDLVGLRRVGVTFGAHPVPDEDCVLGCRRILDLTRDLRPEDLVFTLGASGLGSLLTLPAPGISLEDIRRTVYLMQIERGAPTSDLSPIRNHLDMLKGGRLAAAIRPARAIHILCKPPQPWEDLVYHNTWVHFFPDASTYAEAVDALHRWDAWDAVPESVRRHLSQADPAQETVKPAEYLTWPHRITCVFRDEESRWATPRRKAQELGVRPVLLATGIHAEASQAGRYAASVARTIEGAGEPFEPPVVLFTGGEMLVTVGRENGIGGRNQEWALSAALQIAGSRNIVMGAVDSDGTDGPGSQYVPDADYPTLAGGLVDGETVREARARGIDLRDSLRRHDTTPPLLALDSGILAPQSTGLVDLGVILVMGRKG